MTASIAAFAPGVQTSLPQLPQGWPIGTYDTYRDAERAVDHLADSAFPVEGITIVGVEPMLVERVAGRLTWSRVLSAGASTGVWFGLFTGLLLSMLSTSPLIVSMLIGVGTGVAFGMASAAVRYGATRGRRDFVSTSQLVARRYDVLSVPRDAERGRDLLAKLAMH